MLTQFYYLFIGERQEEFWGPCLMFRLENAMLAKGDALQSSGQGTAVFFKRAINANKTVAFSLPSLLLE